MVQGSLLCCGLWFISKLSTAPAWDIAAGALAGGVGRGSACCQGVVGWDITLGPVRTPVLQRWRWGVKSRRNPAVERGARGLLPALHHLGGAIFMHPGPS